MVAAERHKNGTPGALAAIDAVLAPIATPVRQLSPTDVAQFIRLGQCQRYLRLRLQERAHGLGFLRDYGAVPQEMPPLLTRSGTRFEEQVEAAVRQRYPTIDCRAEAPDVARSPDNERVLAAMRALPAGAVSVLLQPRLEITLDGWLLRGDIDLLRLERTTGGELDALIADMKSSAITKMEHRLQVAVYQVMLEGICREAGLGPLTVRTAIVYRGPAGPQPRADPAQLALAEAHRAAAETLLGTRAALLECIEDQAAYRDAVADLVTGPAAVARRVAAMPFPAVPFHLTARCDGCLYNAFCLKWAAEHDDLSLVPHLTASEKNILQRHGITTVQQLATLKEVQPLAERGRDGAPATALQPAPGREQTVRRLAATWPVGPRLDELIHRARRYRNLQGDQLPLARSRWVDGHGSLPYCDATHNPNLVRIYIDAQHDHLHDRIYLLGALVVGCEAGQPVPARRRSVVHLTDGPPARPEQEERLFLRWIRDLLEAIAAVAAPDEHGEPCAPIHLIFYDFQEQRLLLDGLARHLSAILGATPLYDFMTQLAAFDSPIATFLDQEMRERKLYPLLCQSLHAVAAYLKFDWDAGPYPFRRLFRHRVFDSQRRRDSGDGAAAYYTGRARFASQIPLEYAYAAWGELEPPRPGARDDFAPYRGVTPAHLIAFQERRLAAMEHITADFQGNRLTQKRPFRLPDLAHFSEKARTLAQALQEFVTIERHVDLAAWKRTRLIAPERRVLMGETLIVRYLEADQSPATVAAMREQARRQRQAEASAAAAPDRQLTKHQEAATHRSLDGLSVRLRLDATALDCDLEEVLNLTTFREGDRLVLFPRLTTDGRLPAAERLPFTPTPRQLLYGGRATLDRLVVERDATGRAVAALAEVTLRTSPPDRGHGYAFGSSLARPLLDDEVYTLDPDPDDWYGYWCARVVKGLVELEAGHGAGRNTLYDRLVGHPLPPVAWPAAAAAGQARFLAGLAALHAAGAFHAFEPSKRAYIGAHGADPLLLVQGPPGTGKSYATAFAIFARLQGALAAGQDYRVLVACKTHAATDVLLANLAAVQAQLRALRTSHPALVDEYLDVRLLDLPLFRVRPRDALPAGVIALPRDSDRPAGTPRAFDRLSRERWCVVAATPGGIYGLLKDRWKHRLFGHALVQCLVLDEASQMNLPEAMMAALPLAPDGQVIVVGDHRQMPPIIKHDWEHEPRRTFQEYRAYESLFLTLLPLGARLIQFEESFRLHADLAEFLRQSIYQQDGIAYFSRRRDLLPPLAHPDPFVAAVLAPDHPLVVVVHDEAASQTRNDFELRLLAPVLTALADPAALGLDPRDGLGVVVPHRAQRAALQAAVPALSVVDPATGAVTLSAVDTVERFQGGERTVILVSATESDREYLLAAGDFLLDPRRLTVALSRAKQKMVLVAARSVFTLFSADEQTFANAQLWRRLLRQTCRTLLWHGERDGHQIEVWGSGAGVAGAGGSAIG